MTKPDCLGLTILEISNVAMCEFWYDYIKLKNGEKEKLCYMDADSFIAYIKTEDIYIDIAKDVEIRFDTSNYELDRSLPTGKNKVIGLINDELGVKTMPEFATPRLKTYSYLIVVSDENKKAEGTKKCLIKRKLKFEDRKHYVEATQLENKISELEDNKLDADSLRKKS